MSEISGVLTQLNNALPSGVDGTRLAQWMLRDGRPYNEIRADIAAAFNNLNAEILTNWGDMVFITTEDHMEYPNGGSVSDLDDITDLDEVDAKKGTTVGHMLDLRVKGGAIGGTHRFFRDARSAVLTASVRDITQRGRNTFEKALLNRFMTDDSNSLGSSGYDLGFCDASGTITYTPPAVGGEEFASTHTHYVGVDDDTKDYDDLLNELAEHLQEHGHTPPYTAKVSTANVASYHALDHFVKPVSDTVVVIDRGSETTGNRYFEHGQVMVPTMSGGGHYIGRYISPYGEMMLYATARIPTGYAGLYKSYGINNEKNPIAVRIHPDVGFGFYLSEEPSRDEKFPVKKIRVEIEYGVSCGRDRTNGVAAYLVSGGTWADPTIS